MGARGQINFHERMQHGMQITEKLHGQQEPNFLLVHVGKLSAHSHKLGCETSR